MSSTPLSNPKIVAERGEKIYQDRYKAEFERDHPGQFVAIDVVSEKAYLGDTPEGVLADARREAPKGLFHLIQVGHAGAFRVSYTKPTNVDWIFR